MVVLIKDSLNGIHCYYVNDNLMNYFDIFFVCESVFYRPFAISRGFIIVAYEENLYLQDEGVNGTYG